MTSALASLTLLLATLSPAAPGDEALPGRDGNYQIAGISVEGTMWEGQTDFGIFIVRFESGGVLGYTSGSGTFRNGTWQQKGNVILLEMNGHYADYRGVIRGDHIGGVAENVTGTHWKWDVKRKGPITKEEIDNIRTPKQ
jgi:hypothetical protein